MMLGVLMLIAGATTVPSTAAPAKSLEVCERKIALGMTYKEAEAQLATGNCFLNHQDNPDEDVYFVHSRTNGDVPYGNLIVLTRYWDMDVHDEFSFADAVLGLLQKTEAEGNTNCKLKFYTQNEPSTNARSAQLVCGSKDLLIGLIQGKGKSNISIMETVR